MHLIQDNLCGLKPKTYNAFHYFAGGPAFSKEFDPCTNNGDCNSCPLKEYKSRAALPSHANSVYVREGWNGAPYSMNRLSQGWRSTAYWGYDWKDLCLHADWYPAEFGTDKDSRWVLMRKGKKPCN